MQTAGVRRLSRRSFYPDASLDFRSPVDIPNAFLYRKTVQADRHFPDRGAAFFLSGEASDRIFLWARIGLKTRIINCHSEIYFFHQRRE
ncbi:MAG: hypothetical protein C4548_07755 [Desulfobacteraceae bacterium]|jgi:hypothetical protein|nr:MAG: hypothetical protein C4548_07755 [Desulfobacteraceae bacterium]